MSINITNCDLEPIQYLGCIQPQGFLLALEIETQRIAYVSENIADISGLAPEAFLGRTADELTHRAAMETSEDGFWPSFQKAVSFSHGQAAYEMDVALINDLEYYVITHLHNGLYVIEYEVKYLKRGIIPKVYSIHSRLLQAKDMQHMLQIAAEEVMQLTGYERVLVYRFLKDGAGEVLAESSQDDSEVYMGLRFPESDIPKQARRLYTINKVRIITDAAAKDVKIAGRQQEPIDLTHSVLRSVSPMHIQYLSHMGVRSSFSISIVYDNKLWGLIACHHSTLLPVDYQVRESVKIIGDLLGRSVNIQSELAKVTIAAKNEKKFTRLYKALEATESIGTTLVEGDTALQDLISADGVAVYFSGTFTKKGQVPAESLIKKIIDYSYSSPQPYWETVSLHTHFPDEKGANDICGVLACKIGLTGDMLLWFRKEYRHQISWAGEPVKLYKNVEIDGVAFQEINPRKSFESWKQSVQGQSAPWLAEEIETAENLSSVILDSNFKRTQLLETNNQKLQVAYAELDNFMHSMSHDISNPLTVISLNADMMLHRSKDKNGYHEGLTTIKEHSSRINGMLTQIKAMSRLSHKDVVKKEVDMANLISEICHTMDVKDPTAHTQKTIGALHNIYGNEVALYQIFSNIIGNAVKYSAHKETPHISIQSFNQENCIVYHIYDNGIGISPGEDIFKVFTRAQEAEAFEGSGIGLSIVKTLLMRQNASIRYCSSPGDGTCFYLTFYKQGPII